MNTLKGKKAFVTGASRGIGREVAKGLASLGCDLVLHARKVENLDNTLQDLKAYPVEIKTISAELSDREAVKQMLLNLDEKHGDFDIVYNNAGVSCKASDPFQTDRQEWDRVMEVNFYTVVSICEHFLPKMEEKGFGRIVNVSSGIANQPALAPYAISKAAIDKYTYDMAERLKGTNVLMNKIDPGWIKTDLGGPNAFSDVDSVLPGMMVPVLLENDGPCGELFRAQDYTMLKL